MPNDKNKQVVATLREKVAKAKAITVTDYVGLNANDINTLRQKLKETEAELTIAKNTLIKKALEEENIDTSKVSKDLEGPSAVVFAYNDAVAPIKALFDFIKKVEKPTVKSAIFDGVYNDAKQVEVISTLPSKEQLIAQVVGGLKAPLSGIVGTFNGVQRKFVYALAAIADKKK